MSDLDPHLRDLREATEPDDARLRRIREPRPARSAGWVVMPLGLAAVAAVGLFAATQVPPDEPSPAMAAAPTPPLPPTPEPIDQALEGTRQLGPWVRTTANGTGTASGTPTQLALDWSAGTLEVEVTPDQGVALTVATEEARVRVTGTVFTVTRGPLGTEVAVKRGSVDVQCGDAPARPLVDGSRTCLPVTPVGWLRRASALQQAGRHAEVIEAARRGRVLDPKPAVARELARQQAAAEAALKR